MEASNDKRTGSEARRIEFSTRVYEFSHGHKPRGRGSWAFARNSDPEQAEIIWAPGSMTYGEAKRHALKECRIRGIAGTVHVLP